MEIKTGYFAKTNKYQERGYTLCSIALYPPRGFGDYIGQYTFPLLAPRKTLLDKWHRGCSEDEYRRDFFAYLSTLNPESILNKLIRRCGNSDKIILLCYETPTDFCHRHLVAEWFNQNIHELNITEFE